MSASVLDRLKHRDPAIVLQALGELLACREEITDHAIIFGLVDQLSRRETGLRVLAASVLDENTIPVNDLLPHLARALNDEHPEVRTKILRYYQKIDPNQQLRNFLIPLLYDLDIVVRINAAKALWKHTRDSLVIEIPIVTGLQSHNTRCVNEACQLISDMETSGAVYLSRLEILLGHKDANIRGNALYAISRITDDRASLQKNIDLLKNDSDPMIHFIISRLQKQDQSRTMTENEDIVN